MKEERSKFGNSYRKVPALNEKTMFYESTIPSSVSIQHEGIVTSISRSLTDSMTSRVIKMLFLSPANLLNSEIITLPYSKMITLGEKVDLKWAEVNITCNSIIFYCT